MFEVSIGLFTGRAELIPSDILSQFNVFLALGTSLKIRNLPVCIGTSEPESHLGITLFREAGRTSSGDLGKSTDF